MKVFFKKILIAAILLKEKFQFTKRTLQEKYFPILDEDVPILVKDEEGKYIILLKNEWINQSEIQLSYSKKPRTNFTAIQFKHINSTTIQPSINEKSRLYFKLSINKTTITIGERLLNMDGTVNFRDVGGYKTTEGQTVKWGKIYRSGHLYKLSYKEKIYFNSLNISDVLDLRGEIMVNRFPDKLPKNNGITSYRIPMESKGLEMRALRKKILNNDLDDFDAEAILLKAYQGFIQDFLPEIRNVFQIILKSEKSILIHCSAGKDRTGFFIGLLLKILGVDDKTIAIDYTASNFYRKKETQKIIEKVDLLTDHQKILPLLEVKVSFWENALLEIEQKYGDFSIFVDQGIGLTNQDISALKAKFLI